MTSQLAVSILALGTVLAAQVGPRFEVAAIRPSTEQGTAASVGLRITDAQVRIVAMSLRDCIAIAYGTKPAMVIAPDWTVQMRWDIVSKLPDGATRAQVPAMLQALLSERFQLKTHTEKRDFPVYALMVGKGGVRLKGTPVDPAETPRAIDVNGGGNGDGIQVALGAGSFAIADNQVSVQNLTMRELAEIMSRSTDRAVVDRTALTDRFTFTLDLTPEDFRAVRIQAAVANGVTLPPQALRLLDTMPANVLGPYFEKTGLQLEAQRAPLDVVVVDSVSRTPTED